MPGFSGLWRYFDGKHLPNGENIYWDFAGIYEIHKMVVNCRVFAHNIRWTDSWKNHLHLWKHVTHFLRAEKDFLFNELTKQNLGGGVNFLQFSPLLGVSWSNLMRFKPPPRKCHGSGFSILKTDRTFKWVWYRRHGTPMGFDPPKSPRYLPLSPLGFRHFDRNQWNRRVLVSRNSMKFKEMSEIAKDGARAAKYRGRGWFES